MAKQEGNYTQIPNIILDDTTLNVYERAILIHIARQTIGYGKKSDGISLSQFVGATGISKAKVIRTIEDVRKKKLLNVVKQTAASGGKSYNRYTLTLVSHKDNLVSDRDNPSVSQTPPLVSDRDIQKKIEQKKIDKRREREHTSNNIYFSISGNELKKEVNSFLNDMSIDANNKTAYKAKLSRQIEREHTQTLETFEEWYLNSKCKELHDIYNGKAYQGNSIVSIHSYMDTNGFDDTYKFIVQTLDNKGKTYTKCYEDLADVKYDLETYSG